ncbi:MAG TPA: insulinase family protein, partial [Caldisericia bacterium]|nr:insulinase family protein [Caldisericia bacterium]
FNFSLHFMVYKDIKIKNKNTKQMHVSIGFKAPSVVSDRYYKNLVLLNIIGGGMSSRLFQKIREKLGLVYAIYTFNLSNNITGANVIYFASSKKNLPRVLEEIKKEFNNVKEDGIKNDEIERSKELLIGNYLLRLENSLARSERNAVSFFRKGIIEDIGKIIEKIQSVKENDIYEELESIDYNKFGYGVTGDISEDEFEKFL